MEKAAVELKDLLASWFREVRRRLKNSPGGKEQNNQYHSDRESQDENGLDFDDYGTKFMLPRSVLCGKKKVGQYGVWKRRV